MNKYHFPQRTSRTVPYLIALLIISLLALIFPRNDLYAAPHAAPEPQSAQPDWTMTGTEEDDKFGVAVAGLDVNGDGYHDLAVSAVGVAEGKRGGKIMVYHGSAAGLSSEPNWSIASPSDSDYLGRALFSAGDANADGFDDLVVSAPGDGTKGTVSLYLGSADGLMVEPLWDIEGSNIGERIGDTLVTGDINGDGFTDYVVGAPDANFPNGLVRIYWGDEGGALSGRSLTVTGGESSAKFGARLATGDANGDGYDDLVVAGGDIINDQYAILYMGDPDGLADSPTWAKFPDDQSLEFGASMTFGDTNGDGKDDLLVGMPGFDSHRGAAVLFHGSATGLEEDPAWSTGGTGSFDYVGKAVAMLPVVNADNELSYEMFVSTDQVGYDTTGGMRRFDDAGDGSIGSALAQQLNQLDDFGEVGSLANIGDVNGDGAFDLAMTDTMFDSYRGRVLVYYGTDVLSAETIAKIKAGNEPATEPTRTNRQTGFALPAAYESMSQEDKIRALLVLMGTEAEFAATIEPTIESVLSLTPDMPEEFVEEFKERMTIDSLMPVLVNIYATHYTAAEIDALLAFHSSEIGQSIAAKQAQVSTAALDAGQTWGEGIAADIIADLEANAASE